MALFSFFRTPKHRQFDYIPRFYDKDEEERKKKFGRREDAADGDTESMKARIRGGLRGGGYYYTGGKRELSKQKRKSNIRLIAILFGLIFILYYGLAVYLPKIEKLVDAVLNQQ